MPDTPTSGPSGSAGPIHTMPSRFIGGSGRMAAPGRKPSRDGSRRGLIITVVAVVVVVLLLGGALLLTRLTKQNANTTNVQNENTSVTVNRLVNLPTTNTNTTANTNGNMNGVTNVPLNGNTPANANANVNAPTNVNTNANANANGNGNTNAAPVTIRDGVDTDRDGVTDQEEDLFGLSSTKTDTDGDTFPDAQELTNLYNPKGSGSLRDSSIVKEYTNPSYGYGVLLPLDFLSQPTSLSNREVLFSFTATGEFFQVQAVENARKLTPRDWYLEREPDVSPSQVTDVTVGGLKGVRSPDRFTVVIADGSTLYRIAYDFGGQTEINFRTTFDMFLQSFRKVPVRTTTNTNTNAAANTNTNRNANTNTNQSNGNTNGS